MFLDENADIRSSASHCLGNISIGNVEFFFPKVMGLIQSDAEHKYLLLTSVKDIIRANKGRKFKYLKELYQILFENAKSEEESVWNVVAECIGLLFLDNADDFDFKLSLGEKFNSPSKNLLTTLAKSLKHSCNRNMNEVSLDSLRDLLSDYLNLCNNQDIEVRRCVIESLVTVCHSQPNILWSEFEELIKIISFNNKFKKEYIVEIDLGPFKHKTDEGKGLRQASY